MVAEVAAGVPGTAGGGFRDALGRHWRLVPVGILASLGLCVLASFAVPPAREVTARVLLVPAMSATNLGANPYLALGGLEPAVSVLARAMSAPDATRSLTSVGAAGTIDSAPDAGTNGPVLLVSVQGTSSATALRTLDLVLAQAPQTLVQLQRNVGVKGDALITATIVSRDTRPITVRKKQFRAVLLAAVVGVAATMFGIALLDRLVTRSGAAAPTRADGRADRPRGFRREHVVRELRRRPKSDGSDVDARDRQESDVS